MLHHFNAIFETIKEAILLFCYIILYIILLDFEKSLSLSSISRDKYLDYFVVFTCSFSMIAFLPLFYQIILEFKKTIKYVRSKMWF